jgi:hypothetical protein
MPPAIVATRHSPWIERWFGRISYPYLLWWFVSLTSWLQHWRAAILGNGHFRASAHCFAAGSISCQLNFVPAQISISIYLSISVIKVEKKSSSSIPKWKKCPDLIPKSS